MNMGSHILGTPLRWVIQLFDPEQPGQPIDADSLPTVALRINQAASGQSVTITKRTGTTGLYDCSASLSGLSEGDHLEALVEAVIAETAYSQAYEWTATEPMRGTDGANTVPPLSAAGVRGALGLASANLDTQLGGIATDAGQASSRAGSILGKLAGITSLAHWLRALTRKSGADASAVAEINDGGGTFDPATDSQEAIRERGDAAWKTATGFATPGNVTSARDAIIQRGDQAWTTGNTVTPPSAEAIRSELEKEDTKLSQTHERVMTNLDAKVSSRAKPEDVQVTVDGGFSEEDADTLSAIKQAADTAEAERLLIRAVLYGTTNVEGNVVTYLLDGEPKVRITYGSQPGERNQVEVLG